MKQYAIFDQMTGVYTFYTCSDTMIVLKDNIPKFVNTKEEVTRILAQTILNVHLKITNTLICKIIEETQDGETIYYDIVGNQLPFVPLLVSPSEKIMNSFTLRYAIYDHISGEQSLYSCIVPVDKGTRYDFDTENVTGILAKQMFDTHLTLSNNQLLTVVK